MSGNGNGWGLQGLMRGEGRGGEPPIPYGGGVLAGLRGIGRGGLPQAAPPPPSVPLAPQDPTPAPLVRSGGAWCVLRERVKGGLSHKARGRGDSWFEQISILAYLSLSRDHALPCHVATPLSHRHVTDHASSPHVTMPFSPSLFKSSRFDQII